MAVCHNSLDIFIPWSRSFCYCIADNGFAVNYVSAAGSLTPGKVQKTINLAMLHQIHVVACMTGVELFTYVELFLPLSLLQKGGDTLSITI